MWFSSGRAVKQLSRAYPDPGLYPNRCLTALCAVTRCDCCCRCCLTRRRSLCRCLLGFSCSVGRRTLPAAGGHGGVAHGRVALRCACTFASTRHGLSVLPAGRKRRVHGPASSPRDSPSHGGSDRRGGDSCDIRVWYACCARFVLPGCCRSLRRDLRPSPLGAGRECRLPPRHTHSDTTDAAYPLPPPRLSDPASQARPQRRHPTPARWDTHG